MLLEGRLQVLEKFEWMKYLLIGYHDTMGEGAGAQ